MTYEGAVYDWNAVRQEVFNAVLGHHLSQVQADELIRFIQSCTRIERVKEGEYFKETK